MVEVASSSPEETEWVAAALARELEVGDVVTVAGELGAGKTTFVRGACRELGVTAAVASPTYAIGNRYEGHVAVSHLDLYRFESLRESDWADIEAYFDDAIAFVEWPEAAWAYLPSPRAAVRLRLVDATNRMIAVDSAEKPLEIAVSASW